MTKGPAPKPIRTRWIIAAFLAAIILGLTAQYWDPYTRANSARSTNFCIHAPWCNQIPAPAHHAPWWRI